MLPHRDRWQLVPVSQTTRLIRMGAGTTPCGAGEKTLFASSTEKRSFVSAHPSRSLVFREDEYRSALDGDSLSQLRRLGRPEEDGQSLFADPHVRWQDSTSEFRTSFPTTEELLKLGDWLKEQGCTHLAEDRNGGVLETGM